MIDLQRYQEFVRVSSKNHTLLHYISGLASESGEVAALVQKHCYKGADIDLRDMEAELGDVIWYVAALCNHHDLDLEIVIRDNMNKLRSRHRVSE